MKNFLRENGVQFSGNQIEIGNKRPVFIDVGLSTEAHQSERMIRLNSDGIVFAFEPIPSNIESIRNELSKHKIILNKDRIGKQVFIIPCALVKESGKKSQSFYVTKNDPGCSSLIKPVNFEIREIISVPIYTLNEFFRYLPFDKFKYIDALKIDAQGSDLDIVVGAEKYINKILFITVELSIDQYIGKRNSTKRILIFFLRRGFMPITLGKNYPKISRILQIALFVIARARRMELKYNSVDPTYVNLKLLLFKKIRSLEVLID
jgi:FkbM family methyltransferase